MSGQPVNLNRFRKQKARADQKTQANENAVKFGRTKAEKTLENVRKEKVNTKLDQHKREP